MVRLAPSLYKTVIFAVHPAGSCPADAQRTVQDWCARHAGHGLSGLVMASDDRWLALLEGPQDEVQALLASLAQLLAAMPHLLMSDTQAKQRSFGHWPIAWRGGSNALEMAVFLGDLRRYSARSQIWHVPVRDLPQLLEPLLVPA
jgi:hypothetical protein